MSEDQLLDSQDLGPAFKIAFIAHEYDSRLFSSFIEINWTKGFNNAKEISFGNFIFGKGFVPKIEIRNFGASFDVGVGVSWVDTPLDELDIGLTGVMRVGLYYESWSISFGRDVVLSKECEFDLMSLSLAYTF